MLSETVIELYQKYGGDDDTGFAICSTADELQIDEEWVEDIIERRDNGHQDESLNSY